MFDLTQNPGQRGHSESRGEEPVGFRMYSNALDRIPGTSSILDRSNTKRTEMRVILIATDGSESARSAVDVGVELAESEGARVVLANVFSIVDLMPEWEERDVAPERLPRPEEEPTLAHALDLASAHSIEAKAELLVGYPPKQIAGLAEEIDADIIVIGSRDIGRLERAALGSTSRELLTLTRRPVLIVRQSPADEPTAASRIRVPALSRR